MKKQYYVRYANAFSVILIIFILQELEGFFDQLKSYLLTMDLYFKNGMYQEILEAFEELKSKNIAETKYPREAMVLATGACYKIVSLSIKLFILLIWYIFFYVQM